MIGSLSFILAHLFSSPVAAKEQEKETGHIAYRKQNTRRKELHKIRKRGMFLYFSII